MTSEDSTSISAKETGLLRAFFSVYRKRTLVMLICLVLAGSC